MFLCTGVSVKLQRIGVWMMIYGVAAIFMPLIGIPVDALYWMDRFPFPINLVLKLGVIYWGYRIWRKQD